jgi:hemolysin III
LQADNELRNLYVLNLREIDGILDRVQDRMNPILRPDHQQRLRQMVETKTTSGAMVQHARATPAVNMSHELRVLPKRMQSAGEELANSISHGIGLCAALIGAPILLLEARRSSPGFFLGTAIFAITLSMLYLGSTLYHAWPQTRGKSVLRTLDHSAIFLLIAGTYTPFTLGPLRGLWGASILALVWALAIFGVFLKATRGPSRHPKFSMTLYLGTGWLALIAVRPMMLAIPFAALFWLVAGGVAYTAGVLFFVNQRLRYSHFIWHLFVLAGSSCHFLAVLSCCAT